MTVYIHTIYLSVYLNVPFLPCDNGSSTNYGIGEKHFQAGLSASGTVIIVEAIVGTMI